MNTILCVVHWLSGLIVVAEALNKLERTSPFAPHLSPRKRLVDSLKAVAWSVLAIGGGGALITPVLGLERPTLQDVCVILGFAVLIVRTRLKEG